MHVIVAIVGPDLSKVPLNNRDHKLLSPFYCVYWVYSRPHDHQHQC